MLPLPPPLEPPVLLRFRLPVGSALRYDVALRVGDAEPTALLSTERVVRPLPDGAFEVSRTLRPRDGSPLKESRDVCSVTPLSVWTDRAEPTRASFPEPALPERPVHPGDVWVPGRHFPGVSASVAELKTFGTPRAKARRGAVVRFSPLGRPFRPGDVGGGSYWVVDIEDGRPLFARVETSGRAPGERTVFTLVRRGVPGLVPKL